MADAPYRVSVNNAVIARRGTKLFVRRWHFDHLGRVLASVGVPPDPVRAD